MDVSSWYSVALAASFSMIFLWRYAQSARLRVSFHDGHYLSSRVRSFLLTALLPRKFLAHLNVLHILFVVFFVTGNGLATGLSLFGLEQLQHRAAALGTINLLPAFIGRRIYTGRLLSTSVQLYHLIHGCSAAVGIVQASLHAGVVIRSAVSSTVENPHVFYSGLVALGLILSLFLILPLYYIRLLPARLIRSVHFFLAALSVPVLGWHVALTSQPGMVAASVCAGLWAAVAIYPRVHAWLYGGGDVHAVVHLEGASIVRVRPKKAMRVYPGCYYYVTGSVFPLALDPPNIVYHWERVDSTVEAYPAPTEGSELHLLVQNMTALMRPGGKVFLDGPYGRNPHPEKYETVVLVAQGRGIAGVLPAALHIAQINRRSRITRRIDLQWKRDNNDNEDWAEESLQALIGLDPHRSLFAAHMYYPRLRVRPLKKLAIPEKHAKQWNTFRVSHDESMNRIRRNIASKSRYAGHMIVMACGEASFTSEIQSFVFRLPTLAEFTQIEFRTTTEQKLTPKDIRYLPGTLA